LPSAESLGPEYSEMHILDLEITWEESEPRTPLVCILSTGSDPTNQIIALAKLKNIRKSTSMSRHDQMLQAKRMKLSVVMALLIEEIH
jgi:dynein heavy chain, axonemal